MALGKRSKCGSDPLQRRKGICILRLIFSFDMQYNSHRQVKISSREIFIHIGSHWNNDLHSSDLPWAISWRKRMSLLLRSTPHGYKCFRAVPGKSLILLFRLLYYRILVKYVCSPLSFAFWTYRELKQQAKFATLHIMRNCYPWNVHIRNPFHSKSRK